MDDDFFLPTPIKQKKEDEERNKRYKKCIEYLELKQKMNNL